MADDGINEEVVIDSMDAPSYAAWQTNTGPDDVKVSYKVYLFDLQNYYDASFNASKPAVSEVGPYTYSEYFNKFDISWSDDGNLVTYNTQKYYIFDPENSNPGVSQDDLITMPYLTAMGFEYLLALIPPEAQDQFQAMETQAFNEKIAELHDQADTLPVGERVAANRVIDNLDAAITDYMTQSTPSSQFFKTLMCKLPVSPAFPDNNVSPFWKVHPAEAYFGWLNDPVLVMVQNMMLGMNQSVDGWSTAVPGAATNWTSIDDTRRRMNVVVQKTGKKNKKEVARYEYYNNQSTQYVCIAPLESPQSADFDKETMFPACELFQYDWDEETIEAKGYTTAFATDYANRIAGTDAAMFGRPVQEPFLEVYISDIYRTAYIMHAKTVEDWHQVKLRRYELNPKDLENATMNPMQAQYYQFGPKGLENVSKVAGLPSFVSQPHFLECDESLIGAVTGLNPNPLVHKTYLDIEPQTGLLCRAAKRLQVNYVIESFHMPVMEQQAVNEFEAACRNTNMSQALNCSDFDVTMQCLTTPSWNIQDDSVMFPYAWVEEGMVLTREDADGLKDTLYWIDDFAADVQFWCFIVAGLLSILLFGMMLQSFYMEDAAAASHYGKIDEDTVVAYKKEETPDGETNGNPLAEKQEPFLSAENY